jgi:putative tricarboxylic transport membrane protein
MLIFGVLGYLMKKFKYDGAPLVLAMVLGPLMDNSLRQSLLMSSGSGMIFFTRPICLVILGAVTLILLLPVLPLINLMRKTVGEAD